MLNFLAMLSMFFGGSKKKDRPINDDLTTDYNTAGRYGGAGESGNINRIGRGTIIEGEIDAEGTLRIDGTVKGTINCQSRVIVGDGGRVEGEIICESMDVHGMVLGEIQVAGILSLKSKANVQGDVAYGSLVVDSGAVFNGSAGQRTGKKGQQAKKGISASLKNQPSGAKPEAGIKAAV